MAIFDHHSALANHSYCTHSQSRYFQSVTRFQSFHSPHTWWAILERKTCFLAERLQGLPQQSAMVCPSEPSLWREPCGQKIWGQPEDMSRNIQRQETRQRHDMEQQQVPVRRLVVPQVPPHRKSKKWFLNWWIPKTVTWMIWGYPHDLGNLQMKLKISHSHEVEFCTSPPMGSCRRCAPKTSPLGSFHPRPQALPWKFAKRNSVDLKDLQTELYRVAMIHLQWINWLVVFNHLEE